MKNLIDCVAATSTNILAQSISGKLVTWFLFQLIWPYLAHRHFIPGDSLRSKFYSAGTFGTNVMKLWFPLALYRNLRDEFEEREMK